MLTEWDAEQRRADRPGGAARSQARRQGVERPRRALASMPAASRRRTADGADSTRRRRPGVRRIGSSGEGASGAGSRRRRRRGLREARGGRARRLARRRRLNGLPVVVTRRRRGEQIAEARQRRAQSAALGAARRRRGPARGASGDPPCAASRRGGRRAVPAGGAGAARRRRRCASASNARASVRAVRRGGGSSPPAGAPVLSDAAGHDNLRALARRRRPRRAIEVAKRATARARRCGRARGRAAGRILLEGSPGGRRSPAFTASHGGCSTRGRSRMALLGTLSCTRRALRPRSDSSCSDARDSPSSPSAARRTRSRRRSLDRFRRSPRPSGSRRMRSRRAPTRVTAAREGFSPRADVDVHQTRTLRHQLDVLNTDHAALMLQVEQAMHAAARRRARRQRRAAPPPRRRPSRRRPPPRPYVPPMRQTRRCPRPSPAPSAGHSVPRSDLVSRCATRWRRASGLRGGACSPATGCCASSAEVHAGTTTTLARARALGRTADGAPIEGRRCRRRARRRRARDAHAAAARVGGLAERGRGIRAPRAAGLLLQGSRRPVLPRPGFARRLARARQRLVARARRP